MKKMGLTQMEIVRMKKLLREDEPPTVKEFAVMFNTTTSIIRSFMPKAKAVKPTTKE